MKGPDAEPLTLAEAKNHLKVEHAVDDALIQTLIAAAREVAEDLAQYTIGAGQEWEQAADGAPSGLPIPLTRSPVASVAEVTLLARDSTTTPVTGTILDLVPRPALLYPPLVGWPAPPANTSWVRTTVRYVAGSDPVPEHVKQALLLLIGTWYDQRATIRLGSSMAAVVPYGVEALLNPVRTTSGVFGA